MPPKPKRPSVHPAWVILFILVVGGLGLGYCEVMYRNGADPLKDGALIGGVTAITAAFFKFFGGNNA